MQEINHKKGKIYYSMGEVAEMFDVNPSLLRYWEQEFDILKPHRNKKGNRLFTPKDVDNIRIIYHLLKERKMKIEVARKYIRDYRKEVDRDAEITEHLMNIRAILLEIKQDLAYGGAVVDDDCDEEPVAVPQQSERETVGKGDEAGETDTGTKTGTAAAADRAPESAAQPTGETRERAERPAPATADTRPPFEEQVLFEVAVPLELMQAGRTADDDGFESEPTMKVKEITAILEEAAPLFLQESYDNSGLLVGDPEAEIDSALICVDATESVVAEAAEVGAGLVLSHHPVIFHPLKRLTGGSYIERTVAEAVRRGIALYACHTNLDSAPEGMSQMLGNLLGLRNVILLEPTATEMPGSGFGIVGEPEHVLPTEEFLRTVRDRLSLKCIRYSGITRPTVRRAALCTGAGASMMSAAKRAGADVYLSADFKYNDFLDADRELVIADIGHFESEYCAIDLIYEIIRKKMPTFALHKSMRSVNPVNYLT